MRLRWYGFVFLGIALIVFGNSLGNTFIWDDEEQIVANQAVHSLAHIGSFFRGSTFNSGGTSELGGLYYKPMLSVVYALLYTLFGPRPFFFHLFQICLHVANTFLLFILFQYLFKDKNEFGVSFWVALLFLIHPINVESVVYIASMQEVLYMFFGLLGLWLVVLRPPSAKTTIGVGAAFLSSLLAKETGMLWIIFAALFIWFYRRKWIVLFAETIFVDFLVYSLLRFGVAQVFFRSHGLAPISQMTVFDRLLSIPKIISFYITTYFYPNKLLIAQHWVVTRLSWEDFYRPLLFTATIGISLMLMTLYIICVQKNYIKKWVLFLFIFVTGLGLHIQLVPLDMTVADRWFYFPQIGLLGMLAVIGQLWLKRVKSPKLYRRVGIFILCIVSGLLGIRTIIRNADWHNGLKLYQHDEQYVHSFDLENNLGVELYRKGDYETAAKHFTISTQLSPQWWTNWNNLGVVEENRGNIAEALQDYQKAIDFGHYYLAYMNKARVLSARDPQLAVTFLQDSLRYLPENIDLWYYYSIALSQTDQHELAVQIAQRLYNNFPTNKTSELLLYIRNRQTEFYKK